MILVPSSLLVSSRVRLRSYLSSPLISSPVPPFPSMFPSPPSNCLRLPPRSRMVNILKAFVDLSEPRGCNLPFHSTTLHSFRIPSTSLVPTPSADSPRARDLSLEGLPRVALFVSGIDTPIISLIFFTFSADRFPLYSLVCVLTTFGPRPRHHIPRTLVPTLPRVSRLLFSPSDSTSI